MKHVLLALLCILPLLAKDSDLDKLPAWAAVEAKASLLETPPEDAEAWVLLQKTRVTYLGSGAIRMATFRVVRILGERGLNEATFALFGLGGQTSKVKTLKGWNLRPDGELIRLDQHDVATYAAQSEEAAFSTEVVTGARLDRVVKGSYVAFEAQEVRTLPQGPATAWVPVLEPFPVRRWELESGTEPSVLAQTFLQRDSLKDVTLRLEARNLEPWAPNPQVTPTSVALRNLPARPRGEELRPDERDCEPRVQGKFMDPDAKAWPGLDTWDHYAAWMAKAYAARFGRIEPVPLAGQAPAAGLEALMGWMRRELAYKQVYLTPERGWIPETSPEVVRRRYGDCKDLTSCLAGGALALGLKPYPVLAAILTGHIPPDASVDPYAFNHVITALKLEASLGYPAEVLTSAGRFLIIDPTDPFTPLGHLPAAHRGRRVLICTEDKGLWVNVPNAAIAPEVLEVRLKGSVTLEGRLEATVGVKALGNCLALRRWAHETQAQTLKEHLMGILGLHGDATMEVTTTSAPLDLARPLELTSRLVVPKALTSAWGEWILAPVGLQRLPAVVQKAGKARVYPVETDDQTSWTCEVDLDLPAGLVPKFRDRHLETPFRTVGWHSELTGTHLHGLFTTQNRGVTYPTASREEGVREARKDRRQLQVLEEEALTFVIPKA